MIIEPADASVSPSCISSAARVGRGASSCLLLYGAGLGAVAPGKALAGGASASSRPRSCAARRWCWAHVGAPALRLHDLAHHDLLAPVRDQVRLCLERDPELRRRALAAVAYLGSG